MFERFTEDARLAIVSAQEEARTYAHGYIGTEHLLLGLLRRETTTAAGALGDVGITLERARAQTVRLVEPGDTRVPSSVPFTPRAKRVLELALRAALAHGHDYIGTAHLLLGILDEAECVAARVLLDLGVEDDVLRDRVMRRLDPDTEVSSERYLPHWQAHQAVELAAEEAAISGRRVDPGDLIIGLAKVDPGVRDVLTRYVSLEELARAFEEARQARGDS